MCAEVIALKFTHAARAVPHFVYPLIAVLDL